MASENTNEKPLSVKLAIQDWFRILTVVAGITIAQTWIASRYVTQLQLRLEATELKNAEQDGAISSVEKRAFDEKDRLGDALMRLSTDVGEIKGTMKVLLSQTREAK